MPVYNDALLLNKSIDSFLKQTLDGIELICVNDGSTDDSLDILNDFSKKYKSIKVLSQENQGSGKARNYGIQEANGQYIGFLDADDFFIDEDTLEKLYDVAVKKDALMVSGNIKLVNDEGVFSPFRYLDYFTDYGEISPEEYGIPWSFYKNIFKADFVKQNKIEFPDLLRGQDPVFLAEILSKVDKVYTVPTDTYAYYYVNGANQCNTSRKRHDHMMHYKMVFDYLSDSIFDEIRHLFRYEMLGFINMMGVDGGRDILDATREIFKDDSKILKDFEDCFYFVHEKDELKDLVEFKRDKNPRISVIVDCDVVDESFDSILNQNLTDYEIIYANSANLNEPILNDVNGDYVYIYNPNEVLKKDAFKQAYINALYNDSDLIMFKTRTNKFKKVNVRKFTFNYEYVEDLIFSAPFNFYRTEFLKEQNIGIDNLFKAIFKTNRISYIKKSLGNISSDYDVCAVENTLKEMDITGLEEEFNLYQVNYLFNRINSKEEFDDAKQRLKQANVENNKKYNLIVNSNSFNEFKLKIKMQEFDKKLNKSKRGIKKVKKISKSKSRKVIRRVKKLKN